MVMAEGTLPMKQLMTLCRALRHGLPGLHALDHAAYAARERDSCRADLQMLLVHAQKVWQNKIQIAGSQEWCVSWAMCAAGM